VTTHRAATAIAALAVATGCAYKSGHYGDANFGDTIDGAPPPPCTLAALSLHAATLSGCSDAGTADGPRGSARFANPVNVALAPSGLAYVADFDSGLIRKVDQAGAVSTLLARSDFAHPFGMQYGVDGYLYVETDDDDRGAHSLLTGTLWKINPASGDATVLGRDIGRPRGLAILADGRFALADHQHHVVELFDPNTAAVTVLAGVLDSPGYQNGTGAGARFAQPYDLVVVSGDLVVSEFDNNRLRRVTLAGVVSNFAGTGAPGHDDGALLAATFDQPKGLAIDATGAIYVTEAGNHDIRKITGGNVAVFAGSTIGGYADDDVPTNAQFYGVEGLDVSADGSRVVIADGNVGDGMPFNHVREVH